MRIVKSSDVRPVFDVADGSGRGIVTGSSDIAIKLSRATTMVSKLGRCEGGSQQENIKYVKERKNAPFFPAEGKDTFESYRARHKFR